MYQLERALTFFSKLFFLRWNFPIVLLSDDFANKPADSVSMCTHLYQLLKKRSLTSFRDKRTYVCQLCLPLAFTFLSVLINFAWLVDQPKLEMHATTHYGKDNFIPFNCPNTSDSDASWLHE